MELQEAFPLSLAPMPHWVGLPQNLSTKEEFSSPFFSPL